VHANDAAPARPGESRLLVASLLGDDPVAADAAAARLAILGRPAVRPLVAALDGAPPAHAVRVLGVLEHLADPLAMPALARAAASDDAATAEAAVGALAPLLQARRGNVAATALDHLTAATLDRGRPRPIRLAALRALSAVDLEAVALVRAQLLSDPDEAIREAAGGSAATAPPPEADRPASVATGARASAPSEVPAALVGEAAAGRLPEDPECLRTALARAEDVSLGDLHRLVEVLRGVERATRDDRAAGWLACRAAAHQALAARGSRLAGYDLRDTLVALGPNTPVGMLSALRDVGDAAALEAIAEAWTQHEDGWLRHQLAAVWAAIVQREGLTRRHGVVRRAAQRWPAAVTALWAGPQ